MKINMVITMAVMTYYDIDMDADDHHSGPVDMDNRSIPVVKSVQ